MQRLPTTRPSARSCTGPAALRQHALATRRRCARTPPAAPAAAAGSAGGGAHGGDTSNAGHPGSVAFSARSGSGSASFAAAAPALRPSAPEGRPGSVAFTTTSGSGSASFAAHRGSAAAATLAAAKAPSGAALLRDRLKRYGLAGLLAYGLLNTAYYSCMFLFVWVYVAKVPPGLGLRGAAVKFLEVFALTWGGSQVRALGSLLTRRGAAAAQRGPVAARGKAARRAASWRQGCAGRTSSAAHARRARGAEPAESRPRRGAVAQVTKVARAAGALALAPVVDRLLEGVQSLLRLESKRHAFGSVVAGCVGLALLLFAGVVGVYA